MTTQPDHGPADTATVRAVYRDAVVVDGSVDPLMDGTYLERLSASGVTAINWTVCDPWADFAPAVEQIVRGVRLIEDHPDRLLLVRSTSDIRHARATGRVGVILGPQNALPCEAGGFAFDVLHALGVRILQLTYNERNAFGDGAAERQDGGLTDAGRRAIRAMNRVGMVVDLSHCGDRTTLEAIELSATPPVVTHANSRTLHPSPRNKTDEQLRALAARGGVIGLTLWSPMLGYARQATIGDWIRQVAYVADLIGIEYVGIGTDQSEGTPRASWAHDYGAGGRYPTITGPMGDWYDYDTRFAAGGGSASDMPRIAESLAELRLTETELRGVLGENFVRVFDSAWIT
ncbi:membrane dipeptidase [Microbacterium sp.]|uniref:dipeptidase n=1 Tax=Microbacterium sp. TaxID=51671 RepID=UPI0031FE76D7|nr:dipeptidase [Microbacterium sp.]